MALEIIPLDVPGDIIEGQRLADLICRAAKLQDGDIIIASQKAISKHEGRAVRLGEVMPSLLAVGIASQYGKDPRLIEVVLSESKRIVRMGHGVLIVETHHGIICANAGVDQSNTDGDIVTMLPSDPDASARALRDAMYAKCGTKAAVIISDTFGRPFRMGQTDCAIGIAGIVPILDYAGTPDMFGSELQVTAIAVADELCAAAELVKKKAAGAPFALIRNYEFSQASGSADALLRPEDEDLFR